GEDLIRFAGHYERFFAGQCGRKLDGLSPEAVACLRAYAWPGNLRELRNAIERAVILAKHEKIFPEDFPAELRGPAAAAPAGDENPPTVGSQISLEKLEEVHLRKILTQTGS